MNFEYSDLEKKAINLAWRTEGLPCLLEKGDVVDDLKRAHMEVLLMFPGGLDEHSLNTHIKTMERLANLHNFDSGKRKYAKEPQRV